MSDLEATGARGQTAAPISATALGRLRSIGGKHGLGLEQTEGFSDPFAEVFARIAASSAAPVQNESQVENEESSAGQEAAETTANDADTGGSQDAEEVVDSGVEVDPVVLVNQDQATEEVQSFVPNGEAVTEVEAPATTPVEADVDIAAVEIKQEQSKVEAIETPEVVQKEVVEYHDHGDSQRERRDSKAVEPVIQTENGRLGGQATNAGDQQTDDALDSLRPTEEQNIEQGITESTDEPRRRRGRRDRNSIDPNAQPASQTNGSRPGQRSEQALGQSSFPEALSGDAPKSTDTTTVSPAARKVEAALVNAHTVATNAPRSTGISQPASGSTSATRPNHQAIDSATLPRDAANAKSEAAGKKTQTADTVSRVKLIQRVSKAFQHLGPEGGVVRLRLAPAELGSVRVEMRIQQRKVQARVVAETEAASTALREHLPELRQRLESQGMEVERIEVESEHGEGELTNHSGQQQGQRWNESGRNPNRSQPFSLANTQRETVSSAVSHTPDPVTLSDGVDVRI